MAVGNWRIWKISQSCILIPQNFHGAYMPCKVASGTPLLLYVFLNVYLSFSTCVCLPPCVSFFLHVCPPPCMSVFFKLYLSAKFIFSWKKRDKFPRPLLYVSLSLSLLFLRVSSCLLYICLLSLSTLSSLLTYLFTFLGNFFLLVYSNYEHTCELC